MHRMLNVDNLSCNITWQPFNSVFINLNLEKDFMPEQ